MRISVRLTLAFWALAMVPTTLGGLFVYNAISDIVAKDTLAKLSSIVEVKKEQIKRFTANQYATLSGVITGLDIEQNLQEYIKTKSASKLKAELKKAQAVGHNFNAVFIVDNKGKVIASSRDDETNFDYSSFDFFNIGRGKHILSDFRLDEHGLGQYFMVLPLNDGFAIGARINAYNLQSIGGFEGLGKTGEVYFVKPDNMGAVDYITPLRFDANAVLMGKNLNLSQTDYPAVKAVKMSEQITTYDNLRGYDDNQVFSAACFLPDDGIGVVAQIDYNEAMSGVNVLHNFLLIGEAVLIILLTISSIALARSISRPIEYLTAQVYGNRDNEKLIKQTGLGFELNRLANAFNKTFAKLGQKEKELESLNAFLQQNVNDEIRKRTKNEETLNKIFANMPIGAALVDEEGNFMRVNDYFVTELGYDKEDLIGKSAVDFIGDYLAYKQGVETFCIEKVILKKDKTQIIAYLTFSYIKDELFVAYVNITEQKKLAEAKKKQEALLIQQSKLAAMGEMIGAIAHQWRQPIAVVNGAMLNLSFKAEFGDVTKQELEEAIDTTTKQTSQMSSTINDFMNFFSPNKNVTQFSLYELCNDINSLVGASYKEHNIKIECLLPPILISCFKNELEQVLLNLFQNAKDAFDEREIEDKIVKLYLNDDDDATLYLCVEDNAGGIKEDILDRIFEPYYTTKPQGKGTGIGLYMSKTIIVNSFKGDLYAENIYEKETRIGVRFSVKIPKESIENII